MAKKSKSTNKPETSGEKLILRNKRAFFEYEILEKLECGLALTGTEVKSLRDGKVSFADSYVTIKDDTLLLLGTNIAEYAMGNRMNHEPTRTRKLLAHKRQIRKLRAAIAEKGLTLVPLRLYWVRGMAKIEIGLARGKALHDKRDSIRDKEAKRSKQRTMRNYGR